MESKLLLKISEGYKERKDISALEEIVCDDIESYIMLTEFYHLPFGSISNIFTKSNIIFSIEQAREFFRKLKIANYEHIYDFLDIIPIDNEEDDLSAYVDLLSELKSPIFQKMKNILKKQQPKHKIKLLKPPEKRKYKENIQEDVPSEINEEIPLSEMTKAIRQSDKDKVQSIVRRLSEADENSALLCAASVSDPFYAQTILTTNSNVDKESALLLASMWNNTDVINVILDQGADINCSSSKTTPLEAAVYSHGIESVMLLLERGAEIGEGFERAINLGYSDIVDIFIENGKSSDEALLISAKAGNSSLVEHLLNKFKFPKDVLEKATAEANSDVKTIICKKL